MTDNPYEYLRDEYDFIVSAGPANDHVDADCFVQSKEKLTGGEIPGFEVASSKEGTTVWQHTLDEKSRELPYCPTCGKGFLGYDECPYCGEELRYD